MSVLMRSRFSFLAGIALCATTLIAAGAVLRPSGVQPVDSHGLRPIAIAGVPTPQQMVVIKEGAPFLVPPGKLLVVTGLGANTQSMTASLLVDGVKEVETVSSVSIGNGTTIRELPVGFVVHAGSTVELYTGAPFGRAWGYVVDA